MLSSSPVLHQGVCDSGGEGKVCSSPTATAASHSPFSHQSNHAVPSLPCDTARPLPDPCSSYSLPAFVSNKPGNLLLAPVNPGTPSGLSAPRSQRSRRRHDHRDRRGGHRRLLHRPFHQRTSWADGGRWSHPGQLGDAERRSRARQTPTREPAAPPPRQERPGRGRGQAGARPGRRLGAAAQAPLPKRQLPAGAAAAAHARCARRCRGGPC